MQHAYSFLGTPLHLILEDEIAEGYNQFVDAFLEAQSYFKQQNGRPWTPQEPIEMNLLEGSNDAYDKVGKIINLLAEINGGSIDITEDMCTSDHLELV
jgi:hypothetical protein